MSSWSVSLGRGVGVGALVVGLACTRASVTAPPEETTQAQAREALRAIERASPALAAAMAPRTDGFARVQDDAREDDDTRGRIVSSGWRSATAGRFGELGARLPERANARFDVGLSRFAAQRLRVDLAGTRPTEPTIDAGRVVYARALTATDRVFTSTRAALSEMLVLHDATAPREFTWNMQFSSGIVGAREHGGALTFEDASHRAVLEMSTPYAVDAHGERVDLDVTWNEAAQSTRPRRSTTNPTRGCGMASRGPSAPSAAHRPRSTRR